MRAIHRSSAVVLVVFAASLSFAGDDDSYLPTSNGRTWTYEVRKVAMVGGIVSAKKKGTVTCKCSGHETLDGKSYAILEWKGEADEHYDLRILVRADEGAVWVAKPSSRELLVVPADFKKRKVHVEVKGDDGTVTVDSRTSTTEEELETPAGKFKCLKVEAEISATGNIVAKRTVWYAKGVGIVKVVKSADVAGGVGAERELVLVKVEK